VCDVDSQSEVSEVEGVAQVDEGEGEDVVCHKLGKVWTRLLQHEEKHNHLLSPVAGLQEIVAFEQCLVRHVGEPLVHSLGVEVPHWSLGHDV
jgi:hypothetical protein